MPAHPLAHPNRFAWIGPLWILAGLLPVLAVFNTPHFGYLPFAGIALVLAAVWTARAGKVRTVVTAIVIVGTAWSVFCYRLCWRGIVRSEQLVHADMLAAPRPPPGSQLFFINLPVTNIYATVALREAWGEPDLTGHVLTFATYPLWMDRESHVEPIDDRSFRLRVDAPGTFSGMTGRLLLAGMRSGDPLPPGTTIHGRPVTVRVEAGDETGMTVLTFTFKEPLDSPDYLFFVSTPDRPAQPCRFMRAGAGGPMRLTPVGSDRRLWTAQHAAWLTERDRLAWIIRFASSIIRSQVFLTG